VREVRSCVSGFASMVDHYLEMHPILLIYSELGKDISFVLVVLIICSAVYCGSFVLRSVLLLLL
jgi:hypothetical protein